MRTLVVDAYDSFVHTIAGYLARLDAEPLVVRNDEATPAAVDRIRPDAVVLGPGPGHPTSAGYVEVIRHLVQDTAGTVPVLGVCLGHQAVGLAFGARVKQAAHLMHGKASRLDHDGRGVFAGMPADFTVVRYHSLIVEQVPDVLEISATATDDGYVMGLRHRELPVESVQFHPESIGTLGGQDVLANFLADRVPAWRGAVRT
jgi:anthranilate synthase component 2